MSQTEIGSLIKKPCFSNLLKVLNRQKADNPVLFELFLNGPLNEKLAGRGIAATDDSAFERLKLDVDAFAIVGFDYVTTHASDMWFQTGEKKKAKTISLNDGVAITDRDGFMHYAWPDPDSFDYSRLQLITPYLPDGMKLMVMSHGGVLENVIALTGYDNLCYMLYEDPHLVQDLFDAVGSRLVRYYEIAAKYDNVGVIMSNDDWGFRTQTFLSPADLRKYVFPWHKKIVDTAHKAGKPVILHSCGYLLDVMDDIIGYMGYDGKHSFEDTIMPVEAAYKRWGGRIAIMGGIDVNFLIRSTPEAIKDRSRKMCRLAAEVGGYALGSGNSIPEYVPDEKFFALVESVYPGVIQRMHLHSEKK